MSKLQHWIDLAAPLAIEPGQEVGSWIWFRGTEHEARTSKLLVGRPLPGDPGQNKTSLFFVMHDGRRIGVSRHRGGKLFRVRICPTTDERKQRERAALDQYRRDEEARVMADLPSTPDEFRARTEATLLQVQSALERLLLAPHSSGFSFDHEFAERVRALGGLMLSALQQATIRHDGGARRRATALAIQARWDPAVRKVVHAATDRAVRSATRQVLDRCTSAK